MKNKEEIMKAQMFKLLEVGMFVTVFLTACGSNITSPSAITRVPGSGKIASASRDVSGFTGLIVNGAGKVNLERTGAESLSLSADDNLLPYIITEVRGGKLVIEFKSNIMSERISDLTYNVTVKNLTSLELNGAVAVDGKNIEASQLTVRVSGAGATKLAGKVEQLDVTLSGAGAHNSENMDVKRANVTNNGAGAAIVRVSDLLNATINGIGAIEYIGNPQVTKSVSGIGVVRHR
jgi:hypothetical protein